jgi:hypothetical protein
VPDTTLYDIDPHAWAMREADAMREVARQHPGLGLDFPHLVEELDGMAGADRRRVESLAEAILEHLLLLEYSPATQPRRHWKTELIDFRRGLRRSLTRSLERHLAEHLDTLYEDAREAARQKMTLFEESEAAERLPELRPYTLEQVRDPGWWPPEPPATGSD